MLDCGFGAVAKSAPSSSSTSPRAASRRMIARRGLPDTAGAYDADARDAAGARSLS
jgi:hypothetical protein